MQPDSPNHVTSAILLKRFPLPSVPVVLLKIFQLIDDDQATARKLEALIKHDPAISARILRLANSALYCFRCQVRSISHAIALLGLNLVKSLAIGVTVFESFAGGLSKEGRYIRQLWMHSFAVALLAQEIWARRSNRTEGEFAFLCGLLHDMGMVLLFREDPVRYSQAFSAIKVEDGPDISSMEVHLYGVSHAALGSMLATHWNFPADLATVIGQHHDPLDSDLLLTSAVAISDMLAKQSAIGNDGDAMTALNPESLMHRLEMNEEEYQLLVDSAKRRLSHIEEFYRPCRSAVRNTTGDALLK